MKVLQSNTGVRYSVVATDVLKSTETSAGLAGSKVVYLVDLADGKSITNGAEEVVAQIHQSHPGYLICYRDTMGVWSQLIVRGGQFHAFGPWTASVPVVTNF
jgi:hypothetical protein